MALIQALFAAGLIAWAFVLGRRWISDSSRWFSLVGAVVLAVWSVGLLVEAA